MCVGMCIDLCIDLCIDMFIDLCVDMCIYVCIDMYRHAVVMFDAIVGGLGREGSNGRTRRRNVCDRLRVASRNARTPASRKPNFCRQEKIQSCLEGGTAKCWAQMSSIDTASALTNRYRSDRLPANSPSRSRVGHK